MSLRRHSATRTRRSLSRTLPVQSRRRRALEGAAQRVRSIAGQGVEDSSCRVPVEVSFFSPIAQRSASTSQEADFNNVLPSVFNNPFQGVLPSVFVTMPPSSMRLLTAAAVQVLAVAAAAAASSGIAQGIAATGLVNSTNINHFCLVTANFTRTADTFALFFGGCVFCSFVICGNTILS